MTSYPCHPHGTIVWLATRGRLAAEILAVAEQAEAAAVEVAA